MVQWGAPGPWRLGAVEGLLLTPFRSRGGLTVEAVAAWSARPEGLSTPAFAFTGARPADRRTRDLGLESPFEYGARIGAARILRLFDDYDVEATISACGRALERNPDIVRPVLDTVARAGARSPWLELALCAPWQGGQPGGHLLPARRLGEPELRWD